MMKKFLTRLLLFCSIVVGLFIVILSLPQNPNNYMIEYDIKMGKMQSVNRPPSIILLGGSSTAFGYDSKMLEDSTRFNVINVGLQAGLGQYFIFDDLIWRLNKGDIVIYSPEYETLCIDGYGEQALCFLYFQCNNYNRNVLHYGHYKTIINNLPKFAIGNLSYNVKKLFLTDNEIDLGVYSKLSFNEYGDFISHWVNDENLYLGENYRVIKDVNIELLDYLIKGINSNSNQIILFPQAISETEYENQNIQIQKITNFVDTKSKGFICPPSTEVYADSLFFDGPYHLRRDGAVRRTRHLITLLKQHGICSLTL